MNLPPERVATKRIIIKRFPLRPAVASVVQIMIERTSIPSCCSVTAAEHLISADLPFAKRDKCQEAINKSSRCISFATEAKTQCDCIAPPHVCTNALCKYIIHKMFMIPCLVQQVFSELKMVNPSILYIYIQMSRSIGWLENRSGLFLVSLLRD